MPAYAAVVTSARTASAYSRSSSSYSPRSTSDSRRRVRSSRARISAFTTAEGRAGPCGSEAGGMPRSYPRAPTGTYDFPAGGWPT
jgi:hypothetical protein